MVPDRDWHIARNSAWTLLILTVLVIGSQYFPSCRPQPKKQIIEVEDESCGELAIGQTKLEQCPAGQEGQKVFVCREAGLQLALNTCKVGASGCDGKTLFEDVKPLLTAKCANCHFTPEKYDDLTVARAKIDSFLSRIDLSSDNPERMPRAPNAPFNFEEKSRLKKWKADGLLDKADCDRPVDTGFINLFKVESEILLDLSRIDADDRPFTRYLVSSHKVNAKDDRLKEYETGLNKAVNSLSFEEDIINMDAIDEAQSIFRFDLRSYGLTRTDWKLVEDNDDFDLESFTDEGFTIKFLTGARKAWLHFDNFGFITQGKANVYYTLTNTPTDLGQLLRKVGVNVQAQFQDFSAQFLGSANSEISLQKNRLIVRFEGREGYVWITFDPVDLDGVPERNLFEFPLLNGTGGRALFNFDASEVIYSLPNGLQAYALFNAAGVRQDAAPLNIVTDTRSPLDPEINNAIDCYRCHNAGIIPMQDQIRDHVLQNASNFDIVDVELVGELYKPAAANNAAFNQDNNDYAEGLKLVGQAAGKQDGVTATDDIFRLNWDAKDVASFLLLEEQEFLSLLRRSQAGTAQVGQLLTGGEITFDQFVQVLPQLKIDLRLFQEPL